MSAGETFETRPQAPGEDDAATLSGCADDVDGVAARRARFLAHAAAASQVAVYEFVIPDGATTAPFHGAGATRDARDQLLLVVSMTGGAVGKAWGGLQARIPAKAADRFEALAKSLIEDFLVAYRR